MNIDNLILEVGRKCNLSCDHCLRGDAQDIEMSYEDAIYAINQFDTINQITFTGGEPTLYTDKICKIIDYIINEGREVYSFYVATNGVKIDMKLILKLAEFYGYVINIGGEPEMSVLDFSTDQYHPTLSLYNRNMLKAFTFISFRNDIPQGGIINEGKAYENGIGNRNLKYDKAFYFYDDDTIELMYINAKGYALPDCDYSYITQDEMHPYSIRDYSVEYIAKHFNYNDKEENIA